MKKKKRSYLSIFLLILVVLMAGSFVKPASISAATKTGLVKVNGKVRYYKKGKVVKKKWKTIKKKKYYFKSNGYAATKSYKVKGVTYIFGANGVLKAHSGSKNKVYKISGALYLAAPSGKAASGLAVYNGKFYYFNAAGKVNKTMTATYQKASVYNKSAVTLLSLLGEPLSYADYDSCFGDGKDREYKYSNFTVGTFVPSDGSEEVFLSVY